MLSCQELDETPCPCLPLIASVENIMLVWQIKQIRAYMEGCIFSYGYFTVSWQSINAQTRKSQENKNNDFYITMYRIAAKYME